MRSARRRFSSATARASTASPEHLEAAAFPRGEPGAAHRYGFSRRATRVTATAFGMGGPIAAIVLHELFDLGVRTLPAHRHRDGDAASETGGTSCSPTRRIRGDGASLTYAPLKAIPPIRRFRLVGALRAGLRSRNARASVACGRCSEPTTASTPRCSRSMPTGRSSHDRRACAGEIQRLGLIATDMETATLLVAGARARRRASQPLPRHRRRAHSGEARRCRACSPQASVQMFEIALDALVALILVILRRLAMTDNRRSLFRRRWIERLTEVRDNAGAGDRPRRGSLRRSPSRPDKLVFSFGTGHGALPALEMFPRTGTIVGFRPIVESTMISFHRVWGDMGARQYRFIHAVEGYGKARSCARISSIPEDTMVLFSHSGVNAVILDIALGAKDEGDDGHRRDVSLRTFLGASPSRHSSGLRNSTRSPTSSSTPKRGRSPTPRSGSRGWRRRSAPIPPASPSRSLTPSSRRRRRKLVARGVEPFVMVNPNTSGKDAANVANDRNYDELVAPAEGALSHRSCASVIHRRSLDAPARDGAWRVQTPSAIPRPAIRWAIKRHRRRRRHRRAVQAAQARPADAGPPRTPTTRAHSCIARPRFDRCVELASI